MALFPTKKISALAPAVALTGFEEFECVQAGNSVKATARQFVLPIDSLVTLTGMGGSLPGSRQLVSSPTIQVTDNGPASTVTLDALFTGALPGNPTSLIGLVAVNGVATTWMRSDAAPALDQGILPTWTGVHTFSAGASPNSPSTRLQSARPIEVFIETDAAVDNGRWFIDAQSEQFRMAAYNDAGSGSTVWLAVDRTALVIDAIALASTALTWNGSPLLSVATAFANPTASIGLAAVNGVATTAMRSDAAPALSQAIVPTWTAQHIFSLNGATNAAILASSARPQIDWNETDAAANNRRWRMEAQVEQFAAQVVNDANSAAVTWLLVDRTANAVDGITLTAGTNTVTLSTTLFSTPGQFRSTRDWALNNLINYGLVVSSNNPAIAWQEADAAANNGVWDIAAIGEQLLFRTVADGVVSTVTWMTVDRTGTVVDTIALAANGNTATLSSTLFSTPNQFRSTRLWALSSLNNYGAVVSSAYPAIALQETDAAANNQIWDIAAQGEQLVFRAVTDAVAAVTNWMTVDRTAGTIDTINFPNGTLQYGGNEVGLRSRLNARVISSVSSLVAGDNDRLITLTGAAFTLSTAALTPGAFVTIKNNDTAAKTLAAGTGQLYWLAGTGAPATGSRTFAIGGLCWMWYDGTDWFVWGFGLS
jgi:hypothetical protein